MRFTCRRTLAVAMWVAFAASLFSVGKGEAQEPVHMRSAGSIYASLTRTAQQQDAAPRTIELHLQDVPLESALATIARLGQLRLTER